MSRTLNVVRMQLINRQTYLWIPLIILGGAFAVTLAIYAIVRGAGGEATMYGGGATAPLWYFLFVGVQALTLTFPFSQAMSVTRREFYLGTLLTAASTSAMLTVIFVIGGFIEAATGGWGMEGYFFALDWVWGAGPHVAALFYFVLAMLFFVIGFWAATVFKRLGALWLTVILIGIGVLLVGAVWLVTRMNAWVDLFVWFASIGAGGLALLLATVVVVLAILAFPALRRATP
ncbi:hypothetical protein [Microbacterium sp. 18062]|uniref:hypothetical protein n=1 Tax=Microbacterium sp. 18062 TaxID=2681410 RepID=UPI00135B0718|nr:hypothetical protein [Microbacterium sp. 18062]